MYFYVAVLWISSLPKTSFGSCSWIISVEQEVAVDERSIFSHGMLAVVLVLGGQARPFTRWTRHRRPSPPTPGEYFHGVLLFPTSTPRTTYKPLGKDPLHQPPWRCRTGRSHAAFNVVVIFPNRQVVIRLGGAALLEQHEKWMIGRRCFGEESIRTSLDPTDHQPGAKAADN